MTSCVVCHDPLVLTDPEDPTDSYPDQVDYPCGEKFHWECILSAVADKFHQQQAQAQAQTQQDLAQLVVQWCPSCGQSVTDPEQTKLVVNVHSEGGVETDYDILPVLVEEVNADPEAKKHTAFLDGCFVGDEELVVQLVTESPQIVNEAMDTEKGWSALFFATVAGHTQLVQFLLANGADVALVDNSGNLALDYAIEEKYQDIIPLLRQSSS